MNTAGAQPKRRGVKGAGSVRPPKKHDTPMAETMVKLELAIRQIQKHNASQLSFEVHHRYAYNLVLYKQGHLLYNSVADLVSTHLEKEARERIIPAFPPSTSSATLASGSGTQAGSNASANVAAAAAGQLFLDRVKEVWDDHYACMSKLRDVLKYMDKVYTGSPGVPTVWDLGLSLFFHHVVLFSTKSPERSSTSSISSSRPSPSSSTSSATPKSTTWPTADPTTVAHHIIATLLNIIRIEREGEVVSRHSIHGLVTILSELVDEGPVPLPLTASVGTGSGVPVLGGVGLGGGSGRGKSVMGEGGTPAAPQSPYKTSFEPSFLRQTEEFYRRESAALLVSCDAPTFLRKVSRRLDEEATRAQAYLAPTTEPLLIRLLEETLITEHLQSILEHPASGLSTLINDSRIDDLQRLYHLFARVETGPAALRAGVSAWIVARGTQINDGLVVVPEEDTPDQTGRGKVATEGDIRAKAKGKEPVGAIGAKTKAALGWVQLVLDLKDKFDGLLVDAFTGDKAMEKSINDAFIVFVNQNLASPEYISLFVDDNLKKGLKGKSEAEVDDVLNKTVSLFRFLIEKDQFETYYNQHLSKRLIHSRSVSDDAERNMLAKFKIEAGAAITKAAEGMMKDVKTSEESLIEFRRYQTRNPHKRPPFEMSAIVCANNNWPLAPLDGDCKLPEILLKGVDAYRGFYDTKHSGRKLTFRPDHGTVEVKVKFDARTHELTVSTYAMVVLALFEVLGPSETLGYRDISAATNMTADDLRRTLQTLACAKYKVLTKTPKGRDVDDTDVFAFNSGFTCNLAKIKIQTVANKVETTDERKETTEKIDRERESVCDACIVRVMKDRKQLPLAEVVSEVITQLSRRFKPQPAMVKKAIERLIEKEYLERDPTDRKRLKYVA